MESNRSFFVEISITNGRKTVGVKRAFKFFSFFLKSTLTFKEDKDEEG